MNKRKPALFDHGLGPWLAAGAVVSMLMTGLVYLVLAFTYFHSNPGELPSRISVTVSAFLPMVITVGVVSTLVNHRFQRHVSTLTRGLRAVANGNFKVRLKPRRRCPLRTAYDDFNKMTAELESIQTLREDFINNFSHEFKTPVTAISGFAELLQEPDLSEEERREYLQVIAEESSRLARLANSTLLLSKLEAQPSLPEGSDFLLDEQIKRCAILLSGAWEKKGISFSADLEPVRYHGDEELMRHVWLNLLSNAIKYTPAGGEVEVSLRRLEGRIEVRVADTGMGMSPEVLAHMFDKYYRGSSSHTESGLGLGLSIAHRIVELCGGRIDVDSVVDQGSTFTVSLPP